MVMKKGIGIDSSVKSFFDEFLRYSSRLFSGERRGLYGSTRGLGKSGQVTVFIIVGIVILFATAGIIYVTKTVTLSSFEDVKDPIIASVPQQFQPIQTYVEGCIRDVGKKGLVILGEQGGYIYPDVVGKFSGKDMTNGDGIELGDVKVPYWHYNKNENQNPQIQYSTLKPKLKVKDDPVMSVEAQLARFVKENIDDCLGNYGVFLQEGFSVTSGEGEGKDVPTEVEVTVATNTVNFWLKRDVVVKKGSDATTMEEFYVKIPLQLQKYYAVAEEITGVEQNFSFLERQALDLIVTYSGVDREKLPPSEAVTFEVVPTVFWQQKLVKEDVKGLLVSYVSALRYMGANNFYRYDYLGGEGGGAGEEVVADLSELYQKNYDNMIVPLEQGAGFEINFDYFGWEPYVVINNGGGQIKPESSNVHFNILNFQMQHYYNTYDISYPVLVTIRDAKAFDSEGYNFVIALESNIRNNNVVKPGYVQPAPIIAIGKSMTCDEDKRDTELVKTVVVDSSTFEPLDAVQIGFSVPNDDDCVMGATDKTGELEAKYPAVYGGVMNFAKEDYLASSYPVDTYKFTKQQGVVGLAIQGTNERVVPLHKIKTMKVSVRKKMLTKCLSEVPASIDMATVATSGFSPFHLSAIGAVNTGEKAECFGQGLFKGTGLPIVAYKPDFLEQIHNWQFVDVARKLDEDEQATVVLTRVADSIPGVMSDDFSGAVNVQGVGTGEMKLVPGIYEVMGFLTSTDELVIPAEKRYSTGVAQTFGCMDFDGCEIPFDEQRLKKVPLGQLQWDVSGMYFEITPEQLYNSQELTFYILGFDEKNVPEEEHKRVIEDLQVMGDLGKYSQQLRGNLQPVFK